MIVVGVRIYIYICIYMFVDKKLLNRTLVIDSPFQRFAVDFLSNLSSPEMLSSLNKSRMSLCNADFALLYEGCHNCNQIWENPPNR